MPLAIPTLDQVQAEPRSLVGLPVQVLRMIRARALSVAHAAEIEELGALPGGPASRDAEDRALTPEEAGAVLGCPPDRLRHRARHWPYAAMRSPASTPKRLRFSSLRIQAYLRGELAQPGPGGPAPVQTARRKRGPRPARLPFPSVAGRGEMSP